MIETYPGKKKKYIYIWDGTDFLKSVKAKITCIKNLHVMLARIDTKKNPDDMLKDRKKNVWPKAYSSLQTYLVSIYLRI